MYVGHYVRNVIHLQGLREGQSAGSKSSPRASRCCVIVDVVRHCAQSENSGYSPATDGRPRVIAAAINGVTRNHITKSQRFTLSSCRMQRRNVHACRRIIPKKE